MEERGYVRVSELKIGEHGVKLSERQGTPPTPAKVANTLLN